MPEVRFLRSGRIISVLACMAVALCLVISSMAFAANGSNETPKARNVAIGWYFSDLFQDGMTDDTPKSGYSYEYIQKVADYNGWTYKYVYGNWSELYKKLLNGEIDVLAGVSKTQDRLDKMLYPNSVMGYESYVLYKHAADRSFVASDLSTFSGKKIGAITNNLMTTSLEEWLAEKHVDAEIVYYDAFEARDRDFAEGRLDALVTTDNNVMISSGYAKLAKVGDEAYYLAVANGKTGILSELNQALEHMQDLHPYFISDLEFKNYGATMTQSTLSLSEEAWLAAHREITFGYLDKYLPFCSVGTNGMVYGGVADVMNGAMEKLHIKDRLAVKYRVFESSDEMTAALKRGEIDAVFPVRGDLWHLEKNGIKATDPVVTTSIELVYRGDLDEGTVSKIAVQKKNYIQPEYIASAFPYAELVEYASIEECLDAVLKGQAGSTTVDTFRTDIVQKNSKYNSLSLKKLDKTDPRNIGVASGNTGLLMLLNRGLKLIGPNYASNVSYEYMADLYRTTATDIIAEHSLLFSSVVGLIASAIVLTIVRSRRKTQKFLLIEEERNRELTEKQALLEEASAEQEAQLEEIHTLNDELETAKKNAEAANEAKTAFLFNMSHDIRTPMNAIMGFRDLLEKHQEEPEKRADYLKKIEESSNILLSIINNVLEMARIEKSTVEMVESAWSAEQFNDTLFSMFYEMMSHKRLAFTWQIDVQNQYVFCDPIKLREIFINILSNAYKYTNPGGSVNMHLEEIPSDREGYVLYRTTISDTGIGMSEDFLPHIFEEFSRENNTTDNKIEGTGLGMPIVKRLVDLMGGTIEVKSKKGEGSTFIVTIPHRIADKQELVRHEGVEIDPDMFKGKRILLAEDNDLNAEIAQEILGESGFVVDRAEDGVICCKKVFDAEDGFYDIILMDIQMPNMNGYEAARKIRSMPAPKKDIPILAMTANAFEEDKCEALRSGMNGHLAKPIDVKELMKTLAGIISRKSNGRA